MSFLMLSWLPLCQAAPHGLVIGDSISIGWFKYAQPALTPEIALRHSQRDPRHQNARDTWYGLDQIGSWLPGHEDLVIFNFGMWDMAYRPPAQKYPWECSVKGGKLRTTPDQYRANLERLSSYIGAHSGRVIWVDTTPVPVKARCQLSGEETAYNQVAEDVAQKHGFYVLRLKTLPADRKKSNDIHYTDAGYASLAAQVETCVRYVLGKPGDRLCKD